MRIQNLGDIHFSVLQNCICCCLFKPLKSICHDKILETIAPLKECIGNTVYNIG